MYVTYVYIYYLKNKWLVYRILLFRWFSCCQIDDENSCIFFFFQCQYCICVPSQLIDTMRSASLSSTRWRWQQGRFVSCWVSNKFLSCVLPFILSSLWCPKWQSSVFSVLCAWNIWQPVSVFHVRWMLLLFSFLLHTRKKSKG